MENFFPIFLLTVGITSIAFLGKVMFDERNKHEATPKGFLQWFFGDVLKEVEKRVEEMAKNNKDNQK